MNANTILSVQRVTPKKYFGQHFLKDLRIAERIAETIPDNIKNILEIGSGTGALTQFLLKKNDTNLLAIEIDKESCAYLGEHYPQLRVFRDDFLTFDFDRIFDGEPFGIVGNFPYNISTEILFKVLDNRSRIPFFAGMFQKEVAERICAAHGNKVYGITSVLTQAFYHTEYLFTVSEQVFVPPPKVKSAVIRLTRKEQQTLDCNERLFFSIVKTAFNQRRKTMRNSLKTFNADLSDKTFDLRPEQISQEQFIEITKLIQNQSI